MFLFAIVHDIGQDSVAIPPDSNIVTRQHELSTKYDPPQPTLIQLPVLHQKCHSLGVIHLANILDQLQPPQHIPLPPTNQQPGPKQPHPRHRIVINHRRVTIHQVGHSPHILTHILGLYIRHDGRQQAHHQVTLLGVDQVSVVVVGLPHYVGD